MSLHETTHSAERSPHRRRLFLALVAILAVFLAFPHAAARGETAIGQIEVDTSPLRAKGLRIDADIIEEVMTRSLEERFADRRAPGGARLVVRLDSLFVAGHGGPEPGDRFGGSARDTLEGEARLISGGRVIAREDILVSLRASRPGTGPWQVPNHERRRVADIADAFAGWVERRL